MHKAKFCFCLQQSDSMVAATEEAAALAAGKSHIASILGLKERVIIPSQCRHLMKWKGDIDHHLDIWYLNASDTLADWLTASHNHDVLFIVEIHLEVNLVWCHFDAGEAGVSLGKGAWDCDKKCEIAPEKEVSAPLVTFNLGLLLYANLVLLLI